MAHNACLRLSMGISSVIRVMAIAIEKTTILEVKATIALPILITCDNVSHMITSKKSANKCAARSEILFC